MTLRFELLKTLGNEARLRILLALARCRNDALTIYKIAKFSGLDRRAVKRHLIKLINANLVIRRSHDQLSFYALNNECVHVQKLLELFNDAGLLAPTQF
jgi:DNA-binding transcriptional ArsR family regulator